MYRGNNLRRLNATAWSNPRYQPIGSRLRGESNREQKDHFLSLSPLPPLFLSLSLTLSLSFSSLLSFSFVDRVATAIAMQAKTITAYNPRASILPSAKTKATRPFIAFS